jgi:hypothetical protein
MGPTRLVRDALRGLTGRNSTVEQSARHTVNRIRWAFGDQFRRRDVHAFRSGDGGARRFGIYAFGSCDLWAVVRVGRPLRRELSGTGCALKVGNAAGARSDVLLQSLDAQTATEARGILARFDLSPDYFRPRLFEPTFEVPGHRHLGPFPKDVVVLSIAADLARVAYRHRESGLLVDPGGWWLDQSLDAVRARLGDTRWFARNFVKVGRLGVGEFQQNLRRLILEVQVRTGAHVLVLNSLAIEPGRPTPDYRLVASPHDLRRREFNVALAELSRETDFAIIDVDRVLKRVGTAAQADFIHYTPRQAEEIAQEIVRVLRKRGVLGWTA